MSVPPVSLNPQTYGWRQADQPSAGSAADDSADSQAGGARVGGATPLMRAMMATVSVTGAEGRTQVPATDDATGERGASLGPAVQQFARGLVQSLRDLEGEGAPGGYSQGLSQRIEGLSQRLAASADHPAASDTSSAASSHAAAASQLPEPSTQMLIQAFTQLKAAMNEPPPNGDLAQRQALGEFLAQLARSFGGADAPLIPTGALVSVRA